MAKKISGSVGKGGKNKSADVHVVQELLNVNISKLAPLALLVVDEQVGSKTIGAIGKFQRNVVGMTRPDRRVDPGGKTLATLNVTTKPAPPPSKATFSALWRNHAGRALVCDGDVFENQCAIRMGQALDDSGVVFPRAGLRTCVGYNRYRFASHAPGHIRSAQQLANLFKKRPTLLHASTKFQKFSGNMNDNMETLKALKGMLFILNGWDRTDHIDVWNGSNLKGGDTSYFSKGSQIWFWKIP